MDWYSRGGLVGRIELRGGDLAFGGWDISQGVVASCHFTLNSD